MYFRWQLIKEPKCEFEKKTQTSDKPSHTCSYTCMFKELVWVRIYIIIYYIVSVCILSRTPRKYPYRYTSNITYEHISSPLNLGHWEFLGGRGSHISKYWKLALACLPMWVWKALGKYKSLITCPFAEYDFHTWEII